VAAGSGSGVERKTVERFRVWGRGRREQVTDVDEQHVTMGAAGYESVGTRDAFTKIAKFNERGIIKRINLNVTLRRLREQGGLVLLNDFVYFALMRLVELADHANDAFLFLQVQHATCFPGGRFLGGGGRERRR